ncbi:MAG: YcxB family protein, partial [Peptostreptococcaceae bacterium]|nr:YcxB family protein [Peptostreptococcaceae bacterium]
KDLIGIIVYGISSLFWFIYCPRLHFKSIKRNITRIIDEGKDTSLFDLREVVVNEREITEEIIDHRTFKSWKKIVKMGVSKDNLFIYVSDVDALIIPKKIIGNEEESKAFIEYITNKFIK